jgi:hypothetical protein
MWKGYLPSDAASKINRDRQQIYGDPTPNMEVLAALISPILGVEVSAEQAAMILVQVKVMREVCGGYDPEYNDNLEDVCGFVNVLYKVKEAHGDHA